MMAWYILMLPLVLCSYSNTFAAPPNFANDNYYHGSEYQNNNCKDIETDRVMYIGETFERKGRCIRVQCLGTLQIWEDRCQVPQLHGNCTEIPAANEFLNYPRCCPLYQCITYQFNEHGKALETRTFDHYGVQRKADIVQEFVITNIRKISRNNSRPHVII